MPVKFYHILFALVCVAKLLEIISDIQFISITLGFVIYVFVYE